VARLADLSVDFTRLEVSRLSGEAIPMTNQEFKNAQLFFVEFWASAFTGRIAGSGMGIRRLSYDPHCRHPCGKTSPEVGKRPGQSGSLSDRSPGRLQIRTLGTRADPDQQPPYRVGAVPRSRNENVVRPDRS